MALQAGNLIICAARAGAPGSRAALGSASEELPAREAVQREASPAKGGFPGQQAWRLTLTSLQPALLFQNCAWALPGIRGTDGAFILAVLFFSLVPKAGLGTNNKRKKEREKGRKKERERERERKEDS